jgi:hypothetical protein
VTLVAACAAAGLLSAALYVLARRRAAAQVLPLGAEPPDRRHRRVPARVVYLGALALVAGLSGLLAWTVDGGTSHPPDLPGETVLLIDVSGSITTQGNAVVERTLASFHDYPPDRHAAIVYFASSAAVGSPTSSPAAELSGLSRLFTREATQKRAGWAGGFDAGTVISRAVALARAILVYEHAHDGRVVLVSDLQDNPQDLKPLHQQLLLLQATHAQLAIMPLPPTRSIPVSVAQLSAPYRAVFGDNIIVSKPQLAADTNGRPLGDTPILRARYPGIALLVALALAACALAVGLFPRLAWRFG